MTDDISINDIFSKSKTEYGVDYDNKLFEQYRIYLSNINSLENRRKMTHSFFLSINTGLIALLGILAQFGTMFESNNQLWIIVGGIAGVLFAYSWLRTIQSYILLGTIKWDIILKIEEKLPLKIHEVEWKILRKRRNVWKKYMKLTDVELLIPIIFICLYICLIIWIVVVIGNIFHIL